MTRTGPWPRTALRGLIREVQRPVAVSPQETYREIGVRSHGRGIFHKEPVLGAELGEKDVFRIEPGDLVFNIVFAWEGAVGVARNSEAGMVASHRFPTYRPIPGKGHVGFLRWFFQTREGAALLDLHSPGAAGRNRTLDRWALLRSDVPAPPVEVQSAIADFLEQKISAIDELIRKKERLIDLLQEKRQAVITKVVTKGLDPSVPTKDSGVLGVGAVPRHWRVVATKRLLLGRPRNGLSPPPSTSGGITTFSIAAVRNGFVDVANHLKTADISEAAARAFFLHDGDILVVRGNGNVELVGSAGIAFGVPEHCIYPDILIRLRTNDSCVSEYLVAALNSSAIRPQVEMLAKTSNGAWKVTGEDLANLQLPAPPKEEQERIIVHLRQAEKPIRAAIDAVSRQLTLLAEYRAALVAAAVTGRFDLQAAEVA